MWEVSFRRYKAAALQVKHNIDKYMSKMHVRIPNSSLGVLVSLLNITALWSFIPRATSQVCPLLLPHSVSADWLVPSQLLSCIDAVRSLQSLMLSRRRRFPSSSCSWRNFLRWNSWENFSRGDCTLLCRLRNSWCLDSLSVVFLGPTKTDLFRLTRWRAAAETRCRSRTPRGEVTAERWNLFDFFFPYCRKLPTAEQLLCFLLGSQTRQIGGYVCFPQTQVICSVRRRRGWALTKNGVLKSL